MRLNRAGGVAAAASARQSSNRSGDRSRTLPAPLALSIRRPEDIG
jgi:hypothetical protein